mmetsp:Transcript_32398/g.92277  ORF Transcript_32398/g.92277 Transcript_32398/m.92277 type:complete len:294 (-) Transcript_32398:2-883(-)
MEDVVDSHIHFSRHYAGGLTNAWLPSMPEAFRRDWTEEDYRAAVGRGKLRVKAAVFVEAFNTPAVEEARWGLEMVNDPASIIAGVVANVPAQDGSAAVCDVLNQLRGDDGALPKGLKGGRQVFMATDDNSPKACLAPRFLDGLEAMQAAGLHWEFCCNPSMAPVLPACCSRLPGMTFVLDHLAHNGNDGGEMEAWGPAIDALGKLPNVYAKMGAVEEWDVPDPAAYMDRAIAAFGFDRILYESNWFVSEAMGFDYDRSATLLLEACRRAGATDDDLKKVFRSNAVKVYRLDDV